MTDDSPVFVDTNVLVFAHVAAAPFHEPALTRIGSHNEAGTELWISRQILREFLAVVINFYLNILFYLIVQCLFLFITCNVKQNGVNYVMKEEQSMKLKPLQKIQV